MESVRHHKFQLSFSSSENDSMHSISKKYFFSFEAVLR